MKIRTFVKRFLKNEDAAVAIEYALLAALVAAIAGFGMIFLGEALATWFTKAGSSISTDFKFPVQPSGL